MNVHVANMHSQQNDSHRVETKVASSGSGMLPATAIVLRAICRLNLMSRNTCTALVLMPCSKLVKLVASTGNDACPECSCLFMTSTVSVAKYCEG